MHAHLFIMDALALKRRQADPARGYTMLELSFDFNLPLWVLVGLFSWNPMLEKKRLNNQHQSFTLSSFYQRSERNFEVLYSF